MNWKVAVGGLVPVVALLAAMSAANVVWGFTGGTIHVSVPKAELSGVAMYGGKYTDGGSENVVVVQEVNSLKCPQGQIIKRRLGISGVENVVIKFDNANLSTVLMKARGLTSSSGTLENVKMTVEAPDEYLRQLIENGTMNNLETDIYFVSIGSLGYTGLSIYFE